MAQKEANALLAFETPGDADCTQAVESVITLKRALEQTIASRQSLVKHLKQLLREQRDANDAPLQKVRC